MILLFLLCRAIYNSTKFIMRAGPLLVHSKTKIQLQFGSEISSNVRWIIKSCLPAARPDWAIFLKFLATNFITKVAQISGKLFGFLKSTTFKVKTVCSTFLATLWGNWATFNSTIWSHCPDWKWKFVRNFRKYFGPGEREHRPPVTLLSLKHRDRGIQIDRAWSKNL